MNTIREDLRRVRGGRFLLANAAFWTTLALLFTLQAHFRLGDSIPFYQLLSHELASFLPCVLLLPFIVLLALRYRVTDNRRRFLIAHALGAGGFVVSGGALMGAFEWLLPWSPGDQGIIAAAGDAILRYIAVDVLIYVVVVAAVQAVEYARESQRRALSEAHLASQLAEARLHVLTAQLQPHFLFNTLNAISALMRDEPRHAERMLARLSELLRRALQSATRAETSLEEELNFLEKYVVLQETRFGSRLQVVFEVDAQLLDVRVPTLLLQPILENAIQHGVARRVGPARIEVSARREPEGDRIRLSVRDNGAGFRLEGERRDGIGLSTTRARLRQLYGEDYELGLSNEPAGGAVCTVVLPRRVMDIAV